MNEILTTQQLLQLLVSMIAGGLAGSVLTIAYNRWLTQQATNARQKGTISALVGEFRQNKILCKNNAQLRETTIASFIRFPTNVSINATFEDRHSFPLLIQLQPEIEAYVLSMLQVNELIDLYRHLLLWSNTDIAPHHYNNLRDRIADICSGKEKLKGVISGDPIVLPTFIDHLLQQVENIRAAHH